MRYIKALAITALALAICVPAFAETQTVKVSGSLDMKHIYRHNLDLRDNNGVGSVAVGTAVPAENPATSVVNHSSEGDSFYMSIAEVEVAADLTDNVSVVLRLYNQRDWNADIYNTAGTDAGTDEFDVAVDLAYAEFKEIFYAPLTLTIGRQDLWFGRGFIIGDFQIQDPNGTIAADELGTAFAYDAARATLDFAPWTVDVVWAQIQEGGVDPEDDHTFWMFNVNYQFDQYNAEAEAYLMSDINRNTNFAAAGTENDNYTHTFGVRGQYDPIDNVTLGLEVAWQGGDYYTADVAQVKQDRNAWGGELFGEYRFTDNPWNAMAGLQYVHFSGSGGSTTGDYEAWNGLFRGPTFGDIRDYQEVLYATALAGDQPANSNQEFVAIYGSIEPMEDMKIDGWLYFFWNETDIISGTSTLDSEIGQEIDIHLTYDYTEDVAFGFWFAHFFPGDLFGSQTTGGSSGPTDDDATQLVSSVSVAF